MGVEKIKTSATTTDLTYLKRSLHYHICSIIDTFLSKLYHSRVSLFFGLIYVFVDFLPDKTYDKWSLEENSTIEITFSRLVSIGCTQFRYSTELPSVAGDSSHSTTITFIS